MRATAFAPATIGNVGPGFDVLGLAVDGLGDRVTVELVSGPDSVEVTGRDASLVPTDPAKNAACIAARSMLRSLGRQGGLKLTVEKGLALSGGLGGSAASSVAGALAAAAACEAERDEGAIIDAAFEAEATVAGRHLDNIAPCVLGGLVLVRSVDPIDVIAVPVRASWFVALATPAVRVETRAARALLPEQSPREEWVRQMANTAAVLLAFAVGNEELVQRSLDDRFAEPRRAPLVPRFNLVKAAALATGALGRSLSGSGPTVFALARDEVSARSCAEAMRGAFKPVPCTTHVGSIGDGARIE